METKAIHFVGIAGIGMSALAQLYASKGYTVRGSDREENRVTNLLREKGIAMYLGHGAKNVQQDTQLLVYSAAVPEDNPERQQARAMHIPEQTYFKALGEATAEVLSIVVSGTHGKTSTTAMLAKLLIDTGKHPTVVAGSILTEYGSNFIAGDNNLFLIEGCEYQRHFLELHPNILVVTNIELDHTDYYRDLKDIQDAFHTISQSVPADGVIVTDTDSLTVKPVLVETQATVVPFQTITIPKLKVPGTFNQENARAAKAAAYALDPDLHEKDLDHSLATFTGTWRRFEYKGTTSNGALVYDDYAHHPTAVQGTLETIQDEFSDKKVIVVFHPHLYSRTKQFFDEFAAALAVADKVYVLPIYAAREKLDSTVSSTALARAVEQLGTKAQYVDSIAVAKELLKEEGNGTLICTMGAGDVYKLGDEIVQ